MKKFFEPSYRGNIPKFFIYKALYSFMLFFPIWVIFLQEKRGLSLSEVTFVDVAFWFTTALTEIPTGVVADTVGRKQSMIISVLMTTGAVTLFGLAQNFVLLMVANSLWAIALTFESGAGVALLYDSLKEEGREGDYTRVRAQLSMTLLISTGVSTILGGLVASWSMEATFVISALLTFVSLLFVLTLKEPPYEPDPETGQRIQYRKALAITMGALKKSPNLRMVMLYRNLLPIGSVLVVVTFFQPHARDIGLPIQLIGVFLFLFRMVRLVGAASVVRVEQNIGVWRWLWLAPLVMFSGLVFLGLVQTWVGLLLFAVAGFSEAITTPITETIVMKYAPGAVRATVLSVDMLIFRLLQSFIEPGLGVLAENRGLPFIFVLMGAGTLVLLFGLMARWRTVWEDPDSRPVAAA